jgi:hypothetical protein
MTRESSGSSYRCPICRNAGSHREASPGTPRKSRWQPIDPARSTTTDDWLVLRYVAGRWTCSWSWKKRIKIRVKTALSKKPFFSCYPLFSSPREPINHRLNDAITSLTYGCVTDIPISALYFDNPRIINCSDDPWIPRIKMRENERKCHYHPKER